MSQYPDIDLRGGDLLYPNNLRDIGSVAPRNALKGLPLHRIDLRVSKDIKLPGGMKVTGIAEVFNLSNHKNYGAYNAQVNSTTFGDPRQNLLNAYQPRVMQLAAKFSF